MNYTNVLNRGGGMCKSGLNPLYEPNYTGSRPVDPYRPIL